MFFETYPLVSECCPGCPEHDRPRGCRNSEYPLRRKVNAPVRVLAADQERSFGDSPEALFLFEGSPSKAIETLMRFRPSIITSDDPAILADSLEINQPSANFMVMSLDELTALARNGNDFYVSGIALAVYSNEATAPKTLDTVWRHLPSHHDLKVIHVTRKNYYIEQLGKTLSDVINGPVISSRCI